MRGKDGVEDETKIAERVALLVESCAHGLSRSVGSRCLDNMYICIQQESKVPRLSGAEMEYTRDPNNHAPGRLSNLPQLAWCRATTEIPEWQCRPRMPRQYLCVTHPAFSSFPGPTIVETSCKTLSEQQSVM
jgi:hypothetical protein